MTTGIFSYGAVNGNAERDSLSKKPRYKNYSHLRESERDDTMTASDRHTFSLVPVGVAVLFTVVLIYIILLLKHAAISSQAYFDHR
jgi:hypothetical protein